ncbi:MAG: AlpA family transcriptional regulator [Pelodictyon luteolum]|uniref:AlpA family transcriptional regulator n=1 Tax=Pelodictyon luteolum TaxID=1100 RepID=A0A165MD38_PELLU|nr:AlpA family phage regulatory protein [Pelodictyon luteolum]KZK75102.1 MAG: AlpA family transcriptional regulator [Pelodictyon luteolum]
MEQKFYRIRQIIGDPKKGIPPIIPVSRASWYKAVAEGRFPKPVRLTEKTSAWRAADIQELVERFDKGMNAAPKKDGAA